MNELAERGDRFLARLREQAQEQRGSTQLWHEANIEGHHLYVVDSSFGDGPFFRCDLKAWEVMYDWAPAYVGQTEEDLAFALDLAERAEWVSRFQNLNPRGGV